MTYHSSRRTLPAVSHSNAEVPISTSGYVETCQAETATWPPGAVERADGAIAAPLLKLAEGATAAGIATADNVPYVKLQTHPSRRLLPLHHCQTGSVPQEVLSMFAFARRFSIRIWRKKDLDPVADLQDDAVAHPEDDQAESRLIRAEEEGADRARYE